MKPVEDGPGATLPPEVLRAGWTSSPATAKGDLSSQILNIMEQGVLVWSAHDICELHDTRIYLVLPFTAEDLNVGTCRTESRQRALAIGELSGPEQKAAKALPATSQPYSLDCDLPSGRIVLTHVRPTRSGC